MRALEVAPPEYEYPPRCPTYARGLCTCEYTTIVGRVLHKYGLPPRRRFNRAMYSDDAPMEPDELAGSLQALAVCERPKDDLASVIEAMSLA